MIYCFNHNVISKKKAKSLVKFIRKNHDGLEEENMGAKDLFGNRKKFTKTLKIKYGKIKDKLGDIPELIKDINLREFGYHIDKFDTESCIMNTYGPGDKYGWHHDESRSPVFDTKISCLINLSDSYEGGEFYTFTGEEILVPEAVPGSLIMLKSYIVHRVAEVLSGERITLTLFMNGPKFR